MHCSAETLLGSVAVWPVCTTEERNVTYNDRYRRRQTTMHDSCLKLV